MYKLFDIALKPRLAGVDDLYFRKDGRTLSLDTYFNVIPIRKMKKYTTVRELVFSQPAEICTEHGALRTSDRISVDDIPENAELLYLKTSDNTEQLTVYAEGTHREIRTAIIICTYKREQQVRENIDYLLSNISDTDIEIILVDNASAIPKDNWNVPNVTVLHNINNGGSGGFACGMRYAAEQKRFTNMLLMDDDVTVDFTAIQKMTGFLSFLSNEYADISVAGSMIYAEKPTIQFECGGAFGADGMQNGFGYNFDLSDRHTLIRNEADNRINYGGWWMMCMPVAYAENGQFPAPFFIKYDDVEYALRCKLKIITLNGVGVWHEGFGSKYNSVQEYFNSRNYLFLMKKHSPGFTPNKAYKAARYLLLEKLCRQQYKMAEAVLIAYEDYLKGEKYLSEINYAEKLAQLRKLNYDILTDDDLKKRFDVRFDEQLYNECGQRTFKRYMQPLLYGHLLPRFLCRRLTITDVISDRKEHYFGAFRTLHFNCNDRKGYMTKKSLRTLLTDIIRIKTISWKGI